MRSTFAGELSFLGQEGLPFSLKQRPGLRKRQTALVRHQSFHLNQAERPGRVPISSVSSHCFECETLARFIFVERKNINVQNQKFNNTFYLAVCSL